MVRASLLSFWHDRRGAAAAEMALVTPILITLMFGSFEMGKFFMDQHVVSKAVRDGARYAGRRGFADYAGCAVGGDIATSTYRLVRTGTTAAGGVRRLDYWADDPTTVTVTISCDTSGTYSGIYVGNTIGTPVVTVTATVPYQPLLAMIGFNNVGLNVSARSRAPVTGI